MATGPNSKSDEWLKATVVIAVRALTLDDDQQKLLTPPFTEFYPMMAEELDSSLEHSLAYERTNSRHVLEKHEREMVGALLSVLLNFVRVLEEKSATPDFAPDFLRYRNEIRTSAGRILDRLGWHGKVDTRHFQYSDPSTGKIIQPELP